MSNLSMIVNGHTESLALVRREMGDVLARLDRLEQAEQQRQADARDLERRELNRLRSEFATIQEQQAQKAAEG